MKKLLTYTILILVFFLPIVVFGQFKNNNKTHENTFDEKSAYKLAKEQGVEEGEIKGYVDYLRNDYFSKKALSLQKTKHSPYNNNSNALSEPVIYLKPNEPLGIGCPNAGFEQFNFNGWTGGTGTVSTGFGYPNYNSTGLSIVNTAGDNAPLQNTINYHTIMSTPPTNPSYPFCVGYDSLACKALGTQTISEVPFVSPYSFDPVSVRMNGAVAGYRACKLKFVTTVSSNNKRFSYSYALVLHDPRNSLSTHNAGNSPYFKVTVKNETTDTELQGCSSYSFNAFTTQPSDSLFNSVTSTGDPVLYRKWNYYSVDLSTLAPGTIVSINFEVGDCSKNGHFAYAYVDAECGGIGSPYSNMCSGSTMATLVAPTGFNSYQWINSSGVIPNATNDSLIVNPAVLGTTYTVNMTSPSGCVISKTVTINLTTVNITNIYSSSSCAGGNSGSASVDVSGSNGIYTYTWTNTGTGLTVSNSQTATNLATGSYNVLVASSACGQRSASISVDVAPPFFLSQPKTFCGNLTYIPQPYGSEYTWYNGNKIIPAPIGIKDTLIINSPNNGDIYTVVYKNSQGCKDSLEYILTEIPSGSMFISNINHTCQNNSNGSAVININNSNNNQFSYFISNSSATITDTVTSTSSFSLSMLEADQYNVIVTDGVCLYKNTFIITSIPTSFTATSVNETICFPSEAKINLTFDNLPPVNCGIATNTTCSAAAEVQIGSGIVKNEPDDDLMPCVFGNYYKNSRHQLLFTSAELLAAGLSPGKLTSISFEVANILPKIQPTTNDTSIYSNAQFNYIVKIKCTSSTILTSTFSNTGFTQVYNGLFSPNTGWNTLYFTQPYNWIAGENIIVDICYDPQSFYTSNPKMNHTNIGVRRCSYFNDDVDVACGTNKLARTSLYRPNVKFGNCISSPLPNTYSLQISSNGSITANYANDSIKVQPTFPTLPLGNTSVIYTITITNPVANCVEERIVEVIYPALTTTLLTTNNSTLCLGASTTLSVSGASLYNWYSISNGTLLPISSSSNVSINVPPVGTNSYVVTGTLSCPGSVPDADTVTVNVKPLVNLNISNLNDVTKCLNTSVILNPTVSSNSSFNSGAPYSYTWTTLPGNIPAIGTNTNSTYFESSNTTTTLVVTVNGNCASSIKDTVQVSNFANDISALISNSLSICQNTAFTLNSIVSGGRPDYNYSWIISPNSNTISTSQNLTYTSPETAGIYTITLNVIDSCSYQYSDFETIIVLPPCNITIPNVITANGDNINDYFKITNIEYHPNTSVTIFDRWGRKVYENSNYNNTWKADDLNDGTYFYVIDVVDDKKYNGFITIFKGK